jgi:hypothetical protein
METMVVVKAISKNVFLTSWSWCTKNFFKNLECKEKQSNVIACYILSTSNGGNQIVSNDDDRLTINKEDQSSLLQLTMVTNKGVVLFLGIKEIAIT